MELIKKYQHLLLNYIENNRFTQEPRLLYEPVDYILSNGGKRLRPILVLMACDLFQPPIEKAFPAAYAVEIFHNFTLLHDDIMDESLVRRGVPSVPAKFGNHTAILSGDVMLVYAYEYLSKLPASILPEVMKTFNQFAREVCEGQAFDMDFETSDHVEISDYLKMIELKTAVLIAGALKIGGIIGEAKAKDLLNLYEFGRNIGIAFQLQDDILDTFGDPEKFGKRIGGDIIQNKKTYLILKALELANADQKEILKHWYDQEIVDDEEAKIEAVRSIFESVEVRKEAEGLQNDFVDKAYAHLKAIEVEEDQKAALYAFAGMLVQREV